jgi:hypothetical protein
MTITAAEMAGGYKVSVTFERKVGLPNYGSATYRAWVEAEVPSSADTSDYILKLQDAFKSVKLAVLQEAGIEFVVGDDGIVREAHTPAVSIEQAAATVVRAFPGSSVSYDDSAATVRVKGKQHGPLPDWFIEQAAAKGVREVWDNRDQIAGTRKPHFKSTDAQGIGFWPPR